MNARNVAFFGLYENLYLVLKKELGEEKEEIEVEVVQAEATVEGGAQEQ